MFYLPIGLAPRLRGLPWLSFLIATTFFVASFIFGPQVTHYQDRVVKAHEAATNASASERWQISNEEQFKRKKYWETILTNDPKLNPWIFQYHKNNERALWTTPWIIPRFLTMLLVVVGIAVFGGFVEKRLGSLVFGFNFIGLYYLGYLVEALQFSSPWGITVGGTGGLFILAGAYFALFPLKEMSLWKHDDIRPVMSLPVWVVVSLAVIALESAGQGGYMHITGQSSWGYFHFVLLLLSYAVFSVTARIRPLDAKYLSHTEHKLVRKLASASGNQALRLIKELLAINPGQVEPIYVYYKKVIAPLASAPVSPENQKFLDKYLAMLVAHFYDHQDYDKIIEMVKTRPSSVLPSAYFRLLFAGEWLELARHIDRKGEWAQALRIYATMLDYFTQPKVRGEALKRAEVVIHRTFKEAIDRYTARAPILQNSKKFLTEYPNSPVSKILIDHVEHFRKVIRNNEDAA